MREELVDDDRQQKSRIELEQPWILHRARHHPFRKRERALVGTDEIVAPDEEIELTGEEMLSGEIGMRHGHRDKEAVTKDPQPRPLPAREGDLYGRLRQVQLLCHLGEVGRDVAIEIDPDEVGVIRGQHGEIFETNLLWLGVLLEEPGDERWRIRR